MQENINKNIHLQWSIEEGAFVAPNATLCGKVNIGKNSFVGTGAIIIDNLKICNNVIIGAGAVVTKDVPAGKTMVGNPARELKSK